MQPRLKNSRQWTPLPEEFLNQIKSVFNQNFKEHLAHGGKVQAAGKIFPSEILVGVGYLAPGTLRQLNWEISIEYSRNKDNVMRLLHLAVDAAGALFEQLFAAENDQDFPRTWEAVEFEGRKIFVQFTTTNTELEAQADRLLGLPADSSQVAQGDWDEGVTKEQIKVGLGLDPESHDDGHGDDDGSGGQLH